MSQLKIRAEFPDKLQFLFKPSRYKIAYGGRGAAKSWGFARALLITGTQRPLFVLCAREYQNSIKDSVHKLLSEQINALNLHHVYDVQETTIKSDLGTQFVFEGLRQNVTRIKSYEGIDVAWVEEAQAVSKNSWDVLIPTIRKDGSEIWVSFNPEFEDDDTYERFVTSPPESAAVEYINWRDNPWFPAVLRDEKDALRKRDPASYDHVWEGKCRQWLTGAIYANELRAAYEAGRITTVPYDPAVAVFTVWDIGHTDDTAIWWYQLVAGEIHIIECYASSGGSPSEYASQIAGQHITIDIVDGEIVVKKGALIPDLDHRRSYRYETHHLPHDAKAKTLAASGKSIQQQLSAALGYDKVRIVANLSREDGIAAARTTFPRCWFDKDKTADGLKALRKYHRETQPDEISLQRNPKHDWTSHYADAFRYLAVAWRSESAPGPEDKQARDPYGIEDEEDADNWKTA